MRTFLQTFHFDQLLHAVHDIEKALSVVVTNIPSPHPAFIIEGEPVSLLVIPVAQHHLRSPDDELPHLPGPQRLVSLGVSDLEPRVGHHLVTGPQPQTSVGPAHPCSAPGKLSLTPQDKVVRCEVL